MYHREVRGLAPVIEVGVATTGQPTIMERVWRAEFYQEQNSVNHIGFF